MKIDFKNRKNKIEKDREGKSNQNYFYRLRDVNMLQNKGNLKEKGANAEC